ncbi:hypothetical protein ACGRHY_28080 [Streptomyces sp. HK10]|uniref:hypothetical protein n=1 Tax=Streptomyces sp. HK10 TaxID=3373255 RepID=UPI00374A2937
MTPVSDLLSTAEEAWRVSRDACRLATATLLRSALPTLRPRHGDVEPHRHLACDLPGGGNVSAHLGDETDRLYLQARGLPAAVMRELCHHAQVHITPFITETSLGRPPSPGEFTARRHRRTQRLTVHPDTTIDGDFVLPVPVAARALAAISPYRREPQTAGAPSRTALAETACGGCL